MIVSFSEWQYYDTEIDVCIVGAGVAGLSLAYKYLETDAKVLIIETGGRNISEASQKMNRSISVGSQRYNGCTVGQFRVMGGNSTKWGGQMLSISKSEIIDRDFCKVSGWPIKHEEIYQASKDVYNFLKIKLQDQHARKLLAIKTISGIKKCKYRLSAWPTFKNRNIFNLVKERVESSKNITILHDATVEKIEFGAQNNSTFVEGVHIKGGATLRRVSAKKYIIATGALEASRVLFKSSNSDIDFNGQIGKHFMDHLSSPMGSINTKEIKKSKKIFSPSFYGPTFYYPRIEIPEYLQKEFNIPSAFMHCQIVSLGPSALDIFKDKLRKFQEIGKFWLSYKEVVTLFKDVPYIIKLAYARFFFGPLPYNKNSEVHLYIDVEQLPNNGSSLYLQDDVLNIDWNIDDSMIKARKVFRDFIIKEIFPNVSINWFDQNKVDSLAHDAFHPCGGTIMGKDSKRSVVDENLKVHSIDNLYIASTSVFPVSGTANPSFTLMCLCFRLFNHLETGED